MDTTPSLVAACRACFSSDGLCLVEGRLEDTFSNLTGVSLPDGMRYVCIMCRAQLAKWAVFRDRCQRASGLLEELAKDGALTTAKVTSIDRKIHKLTLNLTRSPVYTFNSDDKDSILGTSIKYESTETDVRIDSHFISVDIDKKDKDIVPETPIKDESSDEDNTPHSPHFISYNIDVDLDDDKKKTKLKDRKAKQIKSPKTIPTKRPKTQTLKRKDKKIKQEGSSEKPISTKSVKAETGNTEVLHFKCKRKKIGDDYYPAFDYAEFEKECKVKIKFLSKEEQRKEIEDRKQSRNYLDSQYRCDICGKGFNHEQPLKNHMSYHDPDLGPFSCEICNFRFRTNRKRLKHVDLHRVMYTCSVCGVVTRDRGSARRHCAQHAGKEYKCRHCSAVFHRTTSYFNHMRAQHPAKNIACEQCGETFLSTRGVRMHQARAHRPNVKSEDHKCSTCGLSFPDAEALGKHTAAGDHSSEAQDDQHKPHRCDECDLSFSSATAFDTHHKRKHLNMRGAGSGRGRGAPRPRGAARTGGSSGARVVCDVCGRSIQNATALKYHLAIHQDVKPYACPLCPKTFAAKHSRDWHTRTHTGERPFQCDQCPQAFSLESNLKRHRRVVHLGIRSSVPCPLCEKIFTTRSSVRLHVNTVHRGLPAPRRKRTKKEAS